MDKEKKTKDRRMKKQRTDNHSDIKPHPHKIWLGKTKSYWNFSIDQNVKWKKVFFQMGNGPQCLQQSKGRK